MPDCHLIRLLFVLYSLRHLNQNNGDTSVVMFGSKLEDLSLT